MTDFKLPTSDRQRREWARGVLADRHEWVSFESGDDVLRIAAKILGGDHMAAIEQYISRHRETRDDEAQTGLC